MRWPTDNPHVSSGYGPRSPFPYHHGADFPLPVAGNLYAIADYEVVWTGWRALGGWTAALRFPDGTVGWYQHMARASTIRGRGKEGDVVGVMGTTGLLTTGIHLHFELRRPNGSSFDPIPYLRAGVAASIPDVKPLPTPNPTPLPETPEEEDDTMKVFGYIKPGASRTTYVTFDFTGGLWDEFETNDTAYAVSVAEKWGNGAPLLSAGHRDSLRKKFEKRWPGF